MIRVKTAEKRNLGRRRAALFYKLAEEHIMKSCLLKEYE